VHMSRPEPKNLVPSILFHRDPKLTNITQTLYHPDSFENDIIPINLILIK
jgi:hypothetical protein